MSNAIVAAPNATKSLSDFLVARQKFIAAVLPKHLTAERVIKVAITAARRTPQLLQCTPESFALAVIQASQLGLEAGSPLGEAYLVPYGRDCTLVVGYRGLIALARRSGEIESIEAHVVHARDRFELTFGLEAKLSHSPHMPPPPAELDEKGVADWMKNSDPGPLVAVYAIARLKGGAVQYEVMTRADVEKIRANSKSGSKGPWVGHFEEMARKTVVRRLAKYLPMSIEMAQAFDVEDRREAGDSLADVASATGIDIREITDAAADAKPAGKLTATDALKARIGAGANGEKPDGDDDTTPPNGTDGRGKGSAEGDGEGADPSGFEHHRAASGQPQARATELRVVREDTEEDLIAKAAAWEHHIGAMVDPWNVRGAFRKRAAAFTAEGVHSERETATLARITALGEHDARGLLYCTTRREREKRDVQAA